MFESVRKFIKGVRRRAVVRAKFLAEDEKSRRAYVSRRGVLKESARLKHIAKVKLDRKRGIMLQDGTLASIENRWVRRAIHRDPSLTTQVK